MKITCSCGASIEIGDNPSADEYRELKEFKAGHPATCGKKRDLEMVWWRKLEYQTPPPVEAWYKVRLKHRRAGMPEVETVFWGGNCFSVEGVDWWLDQPMATPTGGEPMISLHDLIINNKMTNGQMLTMLKEERIMVPASLVKYAGEQTAGGSSDPYLPFKDAMDAKKRVWFENDDGIMELPDALYMLSRPVNRLFIEGEDIPMQPTQDPGPKELTGECRVPGKGELFHMRFERSYEELDLRWYSGRRWICRNKKE